MNIVLGNYVSGSLINQIADMAAPEEIDILRHI